MSTSSKELAADLEALASRQGGYFTARQALGVGYADSVHGYHVKNGDWEKVHRGIYRLEGVEQGDWPDLVLWSFWSCGRDDEPEGVYSRETALAIHEGRMKPEKTLHMTVPKTFRRSAAIPKALKLHKEDLAKGEIEDRGTYRVTTLERTLKDLGREEGVGRAPSPVSGTGKKAGLKGTGGGARPTGIPGRTVAKGTGEGARPTKTHKKADADGPRGEALAGVQLKFIRWVEPNVPGGTYPPAKPSMWSPGMTFEDAIEAGED